MALRNLNTYNIELSKHDVSKISKIKTILDSSNRSILGDRKLKTPHRKNKIKYIDELKIRQLFPKIKEILIGLIDGKPKFDFKKRCELISNLFIEEGFPFCRKISDNTIKKGAIDDSTLDILIEAEHLRTDELAKESLAMLFGISRSSVNRILYQKPESLFNFLDQKTIKGTPDFLATIESIANRSRHIQELKKL